MPYAQLQESIFYAHHRSRTLPQGAPSLVCVHGAGGSHLNWPVEIRQLPGASVYVLDLPGHGRSAGEGCRSIEGYAAVLSDFLDALQLEQAVMVGHSMGGAIAQQMALSYPDRVQALVLIGTGARLRVAPAILQAILEDFETAVSSMVDWVYSPDASPLLRQQGQQVLAQTPQQVMHGDFVACDTFDVMDRLGEVRAPALVITGTADRLTPVKYARLLAQQIPTAHIELLENAGHMVMLERPRQVADAVSRFLSALPGRF
ncbi:MAG: alpha/beta fold hydrolase [Chloroflexota bacterium]